MWLWIGPIIILGVVPAIDLVAGLDRSNPPDDVIERLENDKYYRWITYLFLPIQYVGFVGAFVWIAKPEWLGVDELSTFGKLGIAISIGCIGGIGINTAHELGHKKESHERWLSKIALAQSFYGHFYIEHNRGHHVRVATPEDPASSRLGENFYQFWPRTVGGSLKSAWRLEKKRYARKGKHPFRIGNDVLNAWLMSAVLWGALMAVLGVGILPLLVSRRSSASRCSRSSTTWSTTGCCARRSASASASATSASTPATAGTPTTSRPTCCSTTCSGTATTTPTRPVATRPCATTRSPPCCPTGYAGMIVLAIVPADLAPGDGPPRRSPTSAAT